MKCPVCKGAEPAAGKTTINLAREDFTLAVKDVPALVCPACGEAYTDEATAARLMQIAGEMLEEGWLVGERVFG